MDCLENIIGISETECECSLEDLGDITPEDINTSASGIWLDQLEFYNEKIVRAGDDCGRGGYWARAVRARRNAILQYKTAYLSKVNETYKPRIDTLNVQLGDSVFTGSLNINTNYAGIKITPAQIKGGFIVVKKIGVLINQTAPVTVKIFSNINGGTLVFEGAPINAIANTLTFGIPTEPVELPMWSYNGYIRYWVVMELNGTFQPKNNRKDCGCAGVQRPYLQWLDFTGSKGNDETNLDGFDSTKEINGIVLDAQIKCKVSELICSSEYPLDFEDESGALGMAYAIRFKTAALLYAEVLSTTNISRESMMNRDEEAKNMEAWNAEFASWINYIAANTNLDENNCYVCKQGNMSLTKSYIKVADTHGRGNRY